MTRPIVLFLVTEDWYFWSHRADLASAALAAGYDVVLGTRFTAHRARIEALGVRCIELPFERSLHNPWVEIKLMWRVAALIADLSPQLVHTVALKPILLSMLACARFPAVPFCHAVTGLGHLFISKRRRARFLRALILPMLRWLFSRPHAWLLLQNKDDRALLAGLGLVVPMRTVLIPGAGVDLVCFPMTPLPVDERPLVILAARMQREKGILEFAAAANRLRLLGVAARCVLVGGADRDNPAGLTADALTQLCSAGALEWWGHHDDMPDMYARATVVCLPSYREGFPKTLLEAAASGRPLVATDVPGCREICRAGETGLLVPPRDAEALASAICTLITDRPRAVRYGQRAAEVVAQEFASHIIHKQTLRLYHQMLTAPGVGA